MLKTEAANPQHSELDLYATPTLVAAFVDDQDAAVAAVRAAASQLTAVVEAAAPRLAAGGRLIYVGAGTSGRLGLLDCVELYPTFSWPAGQAIALIAGGERALHDAVEGAEDDVVAGGRDLLARHPWQNDVVLLISASGQTPYVMGALQAARQAGALTVGVVNNTQAVIAATADLPVVLDTGPEVITGSTRLKAGTAQKIALNTLSSAIMVRLNKVYGNLMVDLQPTNAKLVARAIGLTARAAGVDADEARKTLEACGFQIKTAIVALKNRVGIAEARKRLAACAGNVRQAIRQDEERDPEG